MTNRQHVFVTEYLRHGDKHFAYIVAYQRQTSNFNTIESAANRLLRNPDIAAAIDNTRDAIRREVEAEIRKELKHELLTIQRKRELLTQIATGEISVLKYYKGKDCNQCSLYVLPTINQMLAAIREDSKLAGHYGNKSSPLERSVTCPADAGGVCLTRVEEMPDAKQEEICLTPQQSQESAPTVEIEARPPQQQISEQITQQNTTIRHCEERSSLAKYRRAQHLSRTNAGKHNKISLPFRGIGEKTQQSITVRNDVVSQRTEEHNTMLIT